MEAIKLKENIEAISREYHDIFYGRKAYEEKKV